LEGSSQRLGALLAGTSDQSREEMYQLEPDTDLGRTSWAALTYLAVLHSHDSWHQRWHHDFYSADAAWNSLRGKLGDKSARRVCAMIAFQNTLRGMLHSRLSCEVSTYGPPKTFCDDGARCLGKLKTVISAALGETLPTSYWRSCAYAALALDGRRRVSSGNTNSDLDDDLQEVEKFVGAEEEPQAKPEDSALLSFEYGNYLEEALCKIRQLIVEKVLTLSQPKQHFCSISLGRHWRKSDVENLHMAICDKEFTVDVDSVSRRWCATTTSNNYSFHHVHLLKPFNLWLDVRIPEPSTGM
jgi:hypothetical protein